MLLRPTDQHAPFVVNQKSIMGDAFIRAYIDDVLRNIRTQVLIKLIKPYTSIELTFISKVMFHPSFPYEY